MHEASSKTRVLIAEDDPYSLQVLEAVLVKFGFDVEAFTDGATAWARIQGENPPHLLILDWMMPTMDGLDVIRNINRLGSRQSFYIIVLTALKGHERVAQALELGANDYVAKPFDPQELRARIAVAQRVLQAEARLIQYGEALEQLAEERARQLVQADKLVTIGTLASGIAHEINNPATFISGNLKVLEECLEHILCAVPDEIRSGFDRRATFAIEEIPKVSEAIRKGVRRISSIASGLKTYSRKADADPFVTVELDKCMNEALELCHNRLKYNVSVNRTAFSPGITVPASSQQLVQVFVNLFLNAADALEGRPNARIVISSRIEDERAVVVIADNGPGIPHDVTHRIFDPFFTTKEVGKGTGLGLAISRNIVEHHGGKLLVTNSREGGAQFTVSLPMTTAGRISVVAETV